MYLHIAFNDCTCAYEIVRNCVAPQTCAGRLENEWSTTSYTGNATRQRIDTTVRTLAKKRACALEARKASFRINETKRLVTAHGNALRGANWGRARRDRSPHAPSHFP